ncbi:hypothetical protein [Streptomyces sp. NPDC050988]|uniref:hypothetical protein n=1 Tax=Streptomyces sp. NPDC050988 TaxID=3365637 RepID=UPI0037A125E2
MRVLLQAQRSRPALPWVDHADAGGGRTVADRGVELAARCADGASRWATDTARDKIYELGIRADEFPHDHRPPGFTLWPGALDYAAYRPGIPVEAVALLTETVASKQHRALLDLGSGTGQVRLALQQAVTENCTSRLTGRDVHVAHWRDAATACQRSVEAVEGFPFGAGSGAETMSRAGAADRGLDDSAVTDGCPGH